MISKLSIDNYALIDKSDIDFKEGFTVITGETGAGKSIMLDALSLLTGVRADSKAVANKDRKTVVEAVFRDPDINLKSVFEENGLDWDKNELILRREISPAGKSRGFVNDTPVNLGVLSDVSERLLDIHSQHSNSLLNKPQEQLAIIDAYGKTGNILKDYKETFRQYVTLRNRIKNIKEAIAKGKENRDFIAFRLEQLDKLKPKNGELESLERESEILGDAERIKSDLTEVYNLIGGPQSALRLLQGAASVIEGMDLTLLDPKGDDNITERINSIKIELRDIADTLEDYNDRINMDPERFEKVQSRIESLYEVMRRFKIKDEEELVALHSQLREEFNAINNDNFDLGSLEKELKELAKELKKKADKLTEARKTAADKFAKLIVDKIQPLGLPNVKFNVEFEKGKMTSEGQDVLTFYCSFNKNHPMQPVAEIASGGEISRVMLGIKSVMAERMSLPTIIFDEIDTGVSGEIADKMGRMMKKISSKIQVMAVTHLPQVAAGGDTHLKVFKSDNSERTVSRIKELDQEEREMEIAGMLSGSTINEVALENARLLLKQ